jgi:5'-3' exonuclease
MLLERGIMGIPKFYRWTSERYPCLSERIKEYQVSRENYILEAYLNLSLFHIKDSRV